MFGELVGARSNCRAAGTDHVFAASRSRSLKRWILPVAVFGYPK
jgi:hypothetical protein